MIGSEEVESVCVWWCEGVVVGVVFVGEVGLGDSEGESPEFEGVATSPSGTLRFTICLLDWAGTIADTDKTAERAKTA